jgi:AhpD family alkylhydroperoxidase
MEQTITIAPRLDHAAVAPGAIRGLLANARYLRTETTLEPSLLHLVDIRASQMNGCAFCLAMHVLEARADGDRDERIHALVAWRESSLFTARERAALAWTEAVTDLADGHVPDDVYALARESFSERELVDLTLAVATINAWNRMNVAFRTPAERASEVLATVR